jgi:hypothetical protein
MEQEKKGIRAFSSVLGCKEGDADLESFLSKLGKKPEMVRSAYLGFLEYKKQGIEVVFTERDLLNEHLPSGYTNTLRVEGIHFYSEGYEGYKSYKGELIDNVTFSDNRDEVRLKLGKLDKSGGGNRSFTGKFWPFWDRYDFGNYSLSFQYQGKKHKLSVITLFLKLPG